MKRENSKRCVKSQFDDIGAPPVAAISVKPRTLAVAVVIVTLLAIIVGANVSIALLGGALAMVVGDV